MGEAVVVDKMEVEDGTVVDEMALEDGAMVVVEAMIVKEVVTFRVVMVFGVVVRVTVVMLLTGTTSVGFHENKEKNMKRHAYGFVQYIHSLFIHSLPGGHEGCVRSFNTIS